MAQAIFIAHGQTRFVRVGNTNVSQGWADGETFYTVPASKRLTIKSTATLLPAGGSSFDSVELRGPLAGESTFVLTAGMKLAVIGLSACVASGFLEDDI